MMLVSWLDIDPQSPFSLYNIPFGVITTSEQTEPHIAIAIGSWVLDLNIFAENDGFADLQGAQAYLHVFSQSVLNAFAALGQPIHRLVRNYLQSALTKDSPYASRLERNESLKKKALFPLDKVTNHLPMHIGDYTDFYAGMNHAVNVGSLFRDPKNALQPNYVHLPVGYHGRASSVVVSGTKIMRPKGQILLDPSALLKIPVLSPTKGLDIELELAAFLCRGSAMGTSITTEQAGESIFGVVLMNDWSARDIQAWEYVPLGPFGSKNFATTISPWIVLVDALEPYLSRGLENEAELLPYLRESRERNIYDINLRVDLTTPSGKQTTITKTSSRNLLWSFPQMLAHHSITGCPMQVGDLLGSGTISGLSVSERGSLLEQTVGGKIPITLEGGEPRTFLEDGDMVNITGWCGEPGATVGFGDCMGTILPSSR